MLEHFKSNATSYDFKFGPAAFRIIIARRTKILEFLVDTVSPCGQDPIDGFSCDTIFCGIFHSDYVGFGRPGHAVRIDGVGHVAPNAIH